jgi:hypothetical protein
VYDIAPLAFFPLLPPAMKENCRVDHCGDGKTSGGGDASYLDLDDPHLADPGSEKLSGRFIHFWVADRSQVSGVLCTWNSAHG